MDSALKRVDRSVGQSQRFVGEYERGNSRLSKSFVGIRNAAAGFGVALGGIAILRKSVSIVRDFQKTNATLAGVLGTTRSEITLLTKDAERLGRITAKSATEVSTLQLAYARLGFSQQEIIDLSQSTINGSIALNAELSQTAELTGAVVNSFDGFSAIDAPKILDTLSLATNKSALNFQKLETSLPIVSGAANAAGVPFTKLVSLLGKASDAGIDASTAATALRNIFIDSADKGVDFNDTLRKIQNSQDKLKAANEAFGKKGSVVSSVLANNIEQISELDIALQSATGTTEKLANEQLNTLNGQLQLLNSAFEGYILDLFNSTNATGGLQEAVGVLARNFPFVVRAVGLLSAAFIIYRIQAKLASKAQKGLLRGLRPASINFIKTAASQGILTASTNLASSAFNRLKLAMASNPFGIILTVIPLVLIALDLFGGKTKEAAEQQERLNTAIKTFETQSKKINLFRIGSIISTI